MNNFFSSFRALRITLAISAAASVVCVLLSDTASETLAWTTAALMAGLAWTLTYSTPD